MATFPGKQFIAFLLLLALGVGSSTCKPIVKHPVNMYGVWTCDHLECGYMLLEIKRNGSAKYGPAEHCRGALATVKGKANFTSAALFVGTAKYKFIEQPVNLESEDSLALNYHYQKYRLFAKMQIKESGLRGGKSYTFYKIINY